MRNFISAGSAEENTDPERTVLWIHAPDYSRNGVIGDIRNVTNRMTEYSPLWRGLDYAQLRYEEIIIEPIQMKLDNHRKSFVEAYDLLDDA